jgi:3-oxoacyl-[acyl-carrier protein] reductase
MTDDSTKTALITGAGRGIGAAIALRLARDGYDIIGTYRSNDETAGQLKKRITEEGRACTLLKFDVSSAEDVQKVLGPVAEEVTPDVLVNNAGITRDSLMIWMSVDDWRSVTDTAMFGFFLVTKAILLGMLKRKSGRIINIVSTAGQSGLPGQANYSAAKAGVIGATKALAKEVAPRGVLVNAVAPGFIETDMTKDVKQEQILQNLPLGRIGRPEEVAGVVSFLASEDAGYITGQVIGVNGGLYM